MPGKVDELVKHLNESPDKLHGDYTPASMQLIGLGEPAIGAVLQLMLSPDAETRLRAQRVLEGITMRTHGFAAGQGWTDPDGEARWRGFWRGLGDLDWEASLEDRRRSVAVWQSWLAARGP